MGMGAWKISQGLMTPGDLIMINALMMQLAVPLNFLGSVYRETTQATVDMKLMFRLMDQPPRIQDSEDALDLTPPPPPSESGIRFDNVTFGYEPGRKIFDGLTLEIPAGKRVAIVGGSGTGKSSLVRLLYRFYEPQAGSISLAGHPLPSITMRSLREAIAIVPQDCVLFHDTIRYNIRYGNRLAIDEQVEDAARAADVHAAIQGFPRRYDTMVGERALKLSRAEMLRVAIAPALLTAAPVAGYDEPASSLDSITEKNILTSVLAATRGKTALIIAHRLSTIADADLIHVLKDGKVVESGTHAELVAPGYRALWRQQHSTLLQSTEPATTTKPTSRPTPLDNFTTSGGGCGNCSC